MAEKSRIAKDAQRREVLARHARRRAELTRTAVSRTCARPTAPGGAPPRPSSAPPDPGGPVEVRASGRSPAREKSSVLVRRKGRTHVITTKDLRWGVRQG